MQFPILGVLCAQLNPGIHIEGTAHTDCQMINPKLGRMQINHPTVRTKHGHFPHIHHAIRHDMSHPAADDAKFRWTGLRLQIRKKTNSPQL